MTAEDSAVAVATLARLEEGHMKVANQEVFDAWKDSKYGHVNVYANTAPAVERAMMPVKERKAYDLANAHRLALIEQERVEMEMIEHEKMIAWQTGLTGTD
jgi:hypothetical protein